MPVNPSEIQITNEAIQAPPSRKEFGDMCKAYLNAHGPAALSELLATLLLNSEYRAESKKSVFSLDVGRIEVQCMPTHGSSVH